MFPVGAEWDLRAAASSTLRVFAALLSGDGLPRRPGDNGTITVSITGCREQIPDPDFYAECIEEAFSELRAAAVS